MIELETGSVVSHYRIEQRLGAGGMGVVYRARDLDLERDVALKFLLPHIQSRPELKARFRREARTLAALDHPNVGAIHGIEEADGQLFLVMAFIEGATLHERIAEGAVEPGRMRELMRRIASGLGAAHARGIVHRDLKSGNVMVTPDGDVKLLDFGLARRDEDTQLTATGAVTGTIAFMSPEQLRGEPTDVRSDIFSLGVVFHHLLTGALPFGRVSFAATMKAILTDDAPPFDRELHQQLRSLEPLVQRCMARDPARRFRSTDELVDALADDAPPVRMPTRPWRNRVLASAALVIAVLLAWRLIGSDEPAPGPRANALAVVDFENLTGDPELAWMERGLAEIMNTALARSEELDVYDARRVAALAGDPEVANELDEAGLGALLTRAGVARMITGTILKSGERLRLEARVVELESGRVVASESAEGVVGSDLFALAGDMIAKLRTVLEIDVLWQPSPSKPCSSSIQASSRRAPRWSARTGTWTTTTACARFWPRRSSDGET